jgi:hypothetical protein
MTDPRMGDHATGLELQIEELVVRRERARQQGWAPEIHALELEIAALQLELAETAEQAAHEHYRAVTVHGAAKADDLTRSKSA